MRNVKKLLGTTVVSAGLLASTPSPAMAYHHYQTQSEYVRHKRHMKTLKRVGIGTAGGAVVGGLIGGGAGAAIGAAVEASWRKVGTLGGPT